MAAVSAQWAELSDLTRHMVSASIGIVDSSVFFETLKNAQQGKEVPIVTLMRTVSIELWLRAAGEQGILKNWDSSVPAHGPFRYPDTLAEQISQKSLPG
jgi:hypothetical protein